MDVIARRRDSVPGKDPSGDVPVFGTGRDDDGCALAGPTSGCAEADDDVKLAHGGYEGAADDNAKSFSRIGGGAGGVKSAQGAG